MFISSWYYALVAIGVAVCIYKYIEYKGWVTNTDFSFFYQNLTFNVLFIFKESITHTFKMIVIL